MADILMGLIAVLGLIIYVCVWSCDDNGRRHKAWDRCWTGVVLVRISVNDCNGAVHCYEVQTMRRANDVQ